MGVSKKQSNVVKQCACGCGEFFSAFPIYTNKRTKANPEYYDKITGDLGATLYIPKYQRGHHPNCKDKQGKPAWNKGLTKSDHPSISKMGFQPGHKPHNDWSHVTNLQRNDPTYRARWINSKQGQTPWNKGLKKHDYPNGIASGKDHGNWCGNKRGPHGLAKMKKIKLAALKRDKYTCQKCGDHNFKSRGSRCRLEVHHIVAVAEDHTLAFNLNNLTTLCHNCHVATDNYGTKVVNKIKNQGGN